MNVNSTDTRRCFLCGQDNPHGFKMIFRREGHESVSEVVIPATYQSFDGVVHGGMVAAFLDEIMADAVRKTGEHAVTGTLTVKYRKPCRIGEKIELRGWITGKKGRIIDTDGKIIQNGELVAEGKGVFVIPREHYQEDVTRTSTG
ncbi:MAG: PaaI family thioesterase [Atribacterota bacterium]